MHERVIHLSDCCSCTGSSLSNWRRVKNFNVPCQTILDSILRRCCYETKKMKLCLYTNNFFKHVYVRAFEIQHLKQKKKMVYNKYHIVKKKETKKHSQKILTLDKPLVFVLINMCLFFINYFQNSLLLLFKYFPII